MEALMHPVRKAAFEVEYDHKAITAYLTPYINQVVYTDHLHGKADEIELEIDDAAGRWLNEWYPEKGSAVNLRIGWLGERQLPCGEFALDDNEFKGPPAVATLKGLAAGIKENVRTKRTVAYSGVTLRQVAEQVAARHGFTVVGDIGGLEHEVLRQDNTTDLAFLARLARDWGYVFSVKGSQLVFHQVEALDKRPAVLVVRRADMEGFQLRDKSHKVYRGVKVSHHNPKTGKTITHQVDSAGVVSGDVLHLKKRAESEAHAEALGKAALRRSGGRQVEGSITLDGDPRLVSGNNVELVDMGRLNGLYQITEAKHTLTRGGGWTVEVEVSRVPG